MIAAYAAAAGLYLFVGHLWWRKVVLPAHAPPGFGRTEPADDAVRLWQQDARAAEARGDVALLIVNATFVLLWPLALAFGWLTARLQ